MVEVAVAPVKVKSAVEVSRVPTAEKNIILVEGDAPVKV
jgi:hypothetical protein